ncbi:unnamed protein product [Closterium sp. Naga37s-1]|nr:unnamed protein product [Closterium sp. Naga37s-1]
MDTLPGDLLYSILRRAEPTGPHVWDISEERFPNLNVNSESNTKSTKQFPIAVRYTCTQGHFYSAESTYYIDRARAVAAEPVMAVEGRDVDEGREEGTLQSMENGDHDEEGISYHANHGQITTATSNTEVPSAASSHAPAAAPHADPLPAPCADPLGAPHANFLTAPHADPLAAPPADPLTAPHADPLAAPPADPLTAPHADPLAAPPAATTTIRATAATAVRATSVVGPHAAASHAHHVAAPTVRHDAASSGNHHPQWRGKEGRLAGSGDAGGG